MINENKLIEEINSINCISNEESQLIDKVMDIIETQPKVGEWIPFTFGGHGSLQCPAPDNEQEVLVSDGKCVWEDRFMSDGETCWLDCITRDLIGLAWQPLPKPYRKQVEE